MTFNPERMKANPGKAFDVILRCGEVVKACWCELHDSPEVWPILIRYTSGGVNFRTSEGYEDLGQPGDESNNPLDLFEYAPQAGKRWFHLDKHGRLSDKGTAKKSDWDSIYQDELVLCTITVDRGQP